MHSPRSLPPDHADQAAPVLQPEDAAAQPSAQEQIRRLAAGAVLGLSHLPAAIPIRRDPKITKAHRESETELLLTPSEWTERLLADHSEAKGRPETQAEQTRVSARTSARQPGDSGRADQSPRKDSGTGSLRLRKGRQESSRGLRQGKGRPPQGREGGCHFPGRRSRVENVQKRTRIEPSIGDRPPPTSSP